MSNTKDLFFLAGPRGRNSAVPLDRRDHLCVRLPRDLRQAAAPAGHSGGAVRGHARDAVRCHRLRHLAA